MSLCLALLGMKGETLKGHMDLLLLAVLADGSLHGYGVIQRLVTRSGGRFDLPEGTVYPALRRLEQAGLLQSAWTRAEGRRRREYRLTSAGRRALARERRGWAEFQDAVAAVVGAG